MNQAVKIGEVFRLGELVPYQDGKKHPFLDEKTPTGFSVGVFCYIRVIEIKSRATWHR